MPNRDWHSDQTVETKEGERVVGAVGNAYLDALKRKQQGEQQRPVQGDMETK